MTKIAYAFFKGGDHRVYVDSAPHFVANTALTLSSWRGFSGSLRMRAINHYRLDGDDPSVIASGHTVFDLGLSKRLTRRVELSLSLDHLTNRDYYDSELLRVARNARCTGSDVYSRHAGLPVDGGYRSDSPFWREVAQVYLIL